MPRLFSDASGNGMGVSFVQQAYLLANLTAAGSTTSIFVNGNFNASLTGTFVATMQLERSFDGGVTFQPLTAGGTPITYTTIMSESFYEPEIDALYRWRCTAYTSGTITCRIGK